jgi:hypothetical protein
VEQVVVDPSAAGFIQALSRAGWTVRRADNRVLEGIRATAQALRDGSVVICQGCEAAAREFSLYRWADDDTRDRVVKEHDHAMDEIRYFVMSLTGSAGVYAMAVER